MSERTTQTSPGQLVQVFDMLSQVYGIPKNVPDFDPLGGLIGTILSQHTSDINSGRAYQQLTQAFPSWEAVRDAPTYIIAEAIKCGGLANIKSRRIQDVLHTLTELLEASAYQGTLAEYLLQELRARTPEEGWRYLRTYPGVGPKTAACVLMFNMNEAIMAIDTHVHRVSRRLGLIGPKVSADKAHDVFLKIVPPAWAYPLHVQLIQHGRRVCHAQRPACTRCPLMSVCTYANGNNDLPTED
ncbi:MAG: endonuclease III [Ktedonobacteraceae bacterium]